MQAGCSTVNKLVVEAFRQPVGSCAWVPLCPASGTASRVVINAMNGFSEVPQVHQDLEMLDDDGREDMDAAFDPLDKRRVAS